MSPVQRDETMMRLIRDVNEIKSALRHVTTNLPLFDIANENTPVSISTDQNNYIPGNYDVLRIDATGDVSITGIANGKKGRFLEIINVGTGKITLSHEDALSLAVNRFTAVGEENIVMFPTARVRIYYDSTLARWQIPDRPAWMGTYGITFRGFKAADTIGSGVGDVQITNLDTIATDEWGLWDGSQINITQTGIYVGVFSGWFSANATGYRRLGVEMDGTFISGTLVNAVTVGGYGTEIALPFFWNFSIGSVVKFYASQNSGSSLTLNNISIALTRVF